MCSALKRPLQCAEQFLELKICVSPQFRAIDPLNPARGFIQQNENVRLVTAACTGKCRNARFGTVTCAKFMKVACGHSFVLVLWGTGWAGGDHTMEGGATNPESGLMYTGYCLGPS